MHYYISAGGSLALRGVQCATTVDDTATKMAYSLLQKKKTTDLSEATISDDQ